MSEVSFLASIGIRTLVINARAQSQRGGLMALLKPQPLVAEVLKTAGIDTIIPMYPDLDTACQRAEGGSRESLMSPFDGSRRLP